jgi:hypothetical protein
MCSQSTCVVNAASARAGHAMTHQNFHRPLSSAQDDRGSVNDSSTTAQIDEFQRRRQLKAHKPGVSYG